MRLTYTRYFTRYFTLTAALALGSAALVLTACSTGEQLMYCADKHRYVVEESRCDGTHPDTYIYHGAWSTDYKPGMQLNINGMYGEKSGRVLSTDQDARATAGLPRTGGFGGNGAVLKTATKKGS